MSIHIGGDSNSHLWKCGTSNTPCLYLHILHQCLVIHTLINTQSKYFDPLHTNTWRCRTLACQQVACLPVVGRARSGADTPPTPTPTPTPTSDNLGVLAWYSCACFLICFHGTFAMQSLSGMLLCCYPCAQTSRVK